MLCKYCNKIKMLCTLMTIDRCKKVRKARKILKCSFRADTVEGLYEDEALFQADSNRRLVCSVAPEIIFQGQGKNVEVKLYPKYS